MTHDKNKPSHLKSVPKRWTYKDGVWHDSLTGWRIEDHIEREYIQIYTDRGEYVFGLSGSGPTDNFTIYIDMIECQSISSNDSDGRAPAKQDPAFYQKIKDVFQSCFDATNEKIEFVEHGDA